MNIKKKSVLTINGGSSGIKFSLYEINADLVSILYGEVESIGTKYAKLKFIETSTNKKRDVEIKDFNHDEAEDFLINWLENYVDFNSVIAIGHRIVQGRKHSIHEFVTQELIDELKKISFYDPEHLTDTINLIEKFRIRYPDILQVACYDSSFHSPMPLIAKMFPIPRQFYTKGIQKYGFHGFSYAYLTDELKRIAGNESANGRLILAHLGNGASLAAVKEGKSIDTSMSFTPASGIAMSTRTGDLDPGVALYLMHSEKLNPGQFSNLINHESGLLGISETSSDMRDLMKSQITDHRAKEAVELFCYQTKKCIGSYAAALGGLDTLIFSGGIGENDAEVRRSICSGLEFLGIVLDEDRNKNNEAVISSDSGKVTVRVMKTNEEIMIAKSVCQVLNYTINN